MVCLRISRPGGQGVQRGGLVAPGGERDQGGVEDPLGGARTPVRAGRVRPPVRPGPARPRTRRSRRCRGSGGPASMVDSLTYHMVDRSGDPRPRRPGRPAVLHHRRHRIPGHGPGRAAPPQRPRQPGGPPDPPRSPVHARCSGPPRRSSRTTASTGCARSSATSSTAEVASRVTAVAGDVATDGLGLDEDGLQLLSECDIVIHSAAAVSFDSPLDAAVEVNLLGPSRVAAAIVAARPLAGRAGAGRAGPLHPGLDRLRGRHPPGRGQRGAAGRQPRSASTWTGGPRSMPPGASAATPTPSPGSPSVWPVSPRPPGASWAGPASTCWPSGPSASARTG